MRVRHLSVATVALGGAVMVGLAASGPGGAQPAPPQQVITPQPLPASASFPVAKATIDKWVADSNQAAMRGHAWGLWAAMAANSGQVYHGQALPIWETWLGPSEAFPGPGGAPLSAKIKMRGVPQGRPLRAFRPPVQFSHTFGGKKLQLSATNDAFLTSGEKYDPEAVAFFNAPQPGPGGKTFSYASGAGVAALNAAWPSTTTGAMRATNEFPVRGIETKPVFGVVKAAGLTPEPIWRGAAASTAPAHPTPQTWTNCVLIDPAGSGALRAATPAEIASAKPALKGLACKTFLYGPLSLFYSFKLSEDEAQSFRASGVKAAASADYAVLLAMHVNTKEIPFWTWQTFWWQPGGDPPQNFPGSKQGQPATLPKPWSQYATCANYDQTTTPGGKVMQVCFNPYLETSPGIPAGTTSNCMSCHGVATAGASLGYPLAYKAPIAFFGSSKYFTTANTHTDFSWALADPH